MGEVVDGELLFEQNPWWDDPAAIDSDPVIVAWMATPARHRPRLMAQMEYDYERGRQVIYTVRGARGVGKTTMAKLAIRDLLRRGVAPMRTFYFQLEPGTGKRRLEEILLGYLDLSEPHRGERRAYIFLDEISTVRNWQIQFLGISNAHRIRNCTTVVTGSSETDLRRATETLPGRMGMPPGGPHKKLLPLSFSEYASLRSPEIAAMTDRGRTFDPTQREAAFMDLARGRDDDRIRQMCLHTRTLDDLLLRYMVTGGTPRVVNSTFVSQTVSKALYAECVDALTSEWVALGHAAERLRPCVKPVLDTVGDSVTWNRLGIAGMGSPHSALASALALCDMHVLDMVYAYDTANNLPDARRPKRLYVRDPHFFHALNAWAGDADPHDAALRYLAREGNRARMARCVAADHLRRMACEFSPKRLAFEPHPHVYYWSGGRGREVDFVYAHPKLNEVPIEVEYLPKTNHRGLTALARFLDAAGSPRGIVATRHDYEIRRDYTLVPLSVLLMLA